MPTSLGRQFIIYSTPSGQTAADGGSSGLRPFSEAFVRHAGTPGLPIEQMMHKVNADLRQSTNNKQVPFTYGSMEQAYYLAGRRVRYHKSTRPILRYILRHQFHRAWFMLKGAASP